MATQSVQRTTELISTSASEFIRAQTLKFYASNLRPNTRVYAYFDGVSVDRFITSTFVNGSGSLTTDDSGTVAGDLYIPAKTFTTGKKQLVILETAVYTDFNILGNTHVSAVADFTCIGTNQRLQTTVTTTNVTTVEQLRRIYVPQPISLPPPWQGGGGDGGDPLAQSFFTTGITGGCFVTSIDLYFATKDTSTPALPTWIELREMVNGYPGPRMVGPNGYATVLAHNVNVSSTASAATNFRFSSPVYLQQDRDYCFVVRSNSDKYTIWTSRMGEESNETGKVVFAQPYSGSLFKSENNLTWSAEQNEDIKFVMYKAAFTDPTALAPLNVKLNANIVAVNCSKFSTTNGSSILRANLPYKHALDGNSRVVIAADPLSTYNGIPGSAFSNVSCTVASIIDEFTVDINIPGAAATSGGSILSGGRLKDILVNFGGTGYTVAPTISISAPSAGGTQATAVATVSNGAIVDVKVTNPGTKYLVAPTITVSSGGATFTPVVDETFTISTNRQYHRLNPSIAAIVPPGTKIGANMTASTRTNYSAGKTYPINVSKETVFDDHLMLVSKANETAILADSPSTNIQVSFSAANGAWNPNVSPVIDFNHSRATFIGNIINSASEIGASETYADSTGSPHLAQTRYITKRESLAQMSKSIRVLATAYSNSNSGFDVFARTSNSGTSIAHQDQPWVALNCAVKRNRSSKPGEFIEYEFYLDDMTEFDTITLKLVLYTETKYDPPVISDYRAIMLS